MFKNTYLTTCMRYHQAFTLTHFNSEQKLNHASFHRIAPTGLTLNAIQWAQDNRSCMMETLISISDPSQLISGEDGLTQKNVQTLPAHDGFLPHINLKMHLFSMLAPLSEIQSKPQNNHKWFHANQTCHSPKSNKSSRLINTISCLLFFFFFLNPYISFSL